MTSEKLIQLEKLYSILKPESFPKDEFNKAWQKVLLYNEHTWGSWNSISAPESQLTKRQWAIKESFVKDAVTLENNLRSKLLKEFSGVGDGRTYSIINTNSWTTTGLVRLANSPGSYFSDSTGRPLRSQKLKDGSVLVQVEDVPPLASQSIQVIDEKPEHGSQLEILGKNTLKNEFLTVQVSEATGEIISIKDNETGSEYVNSSAGSGLNQFIYINGRSPERAQYAANAAVSIVENGPLLVSLQVKRDAPGCRSLTTEISLFAGRREIVIENLIDKEKVRTPEGVHFAFPFALENAVAHLDTAWAQFKPGSEQLPGSCMNYYTLQRWLDISSKDAGVTIYSTHAPLVEFGRISADPISTGWKKEPGDVSKVFSYVMNNYWETNYKADQEGVASFRYHLLFHGGFDPAAAERFALSRSQELVAIPGAEKANIKSPLVRVNSASVNITSIESKRGGERIQVRLFNSGDQARIIKPLWERKQPKEVHVLTPQGRKKLNGAIQLEPMEILTLEAIF